MANEAPPESEPSLASLLGSLINDARDLAVHQLKLAKLELQGELRKTKTAAVVLGSGIGSALIGGTLLTFLLVHVLAALTEIPLWGCYGMVGCVLALLGGDCLPRVKTEERPST